MKKKFEIKKLFGVELRLCHVERSKTSYVSVKILLVDISLRRKSPCYPLSVTLSVSEGALCVIIVAGVLPILFFLPKTGCRRESRFRYA